MKNYLFLSLACAICLLSCEGPHVTNLSEDFSVEKISIWGSGVEISYHRHKYYSSNIAVGICWDTLPMPIRESGKYKERNDVRLSDLTFRLDLKEKTTYYARFYLSALPYSITYGDEFTFTTDSEFVDLGLSVKWSVRNLGATKNIVCGEYFAWGETEPKEDYSYITYKWCMGAANTLTKYCTQSNCGYNGFMDNDTILHLDDDAAYKYYGKNVHIPTPAQWDELSSSCTWKRGRQNGRDGYIVTSKKNQNSIFLPDAGYRVGTGIGSQSRSIYYTNTLRSGDNRYAKTYCIPSNYSYNSPPAQLVPGSAERTLGCSVRAVYEE